MRLVTVAQAVAFLRQTGIATVSARVEGVPCVVHEIVGRPITGSWWGHRQGKQIYALLEALEDRDDVLCLKLLRGKATYVHRALWPALLAVVLDEAWRRPRVQKLPSAARALLALVERGSQRGAPVGPAKALEVSLLVYGASEHTDAGRHEKRLTSWAHWARAHQVGPTGTATEGAALLRARAGGQRTSLEPMA